MKPPSDASASAASLDPRAARWRLLLDGLGIAASGVGFGLVLGLAARDAGLSPLEVAAMSSIVFAGAAQFAAIGGLVAGLPWPSIVLITLVLNARHLLYSAALAPRLQAFPLPRRALMAHFLTDESFALTSAHFQRLGRADEAGYWLAAVVYEFIPWNVSTIAGSLLGSAIPDPATFGLDVVFPASMAGLALGLMIGRREAVAAGAGAAIGVGLSLVAGTQVGIVAGGLAGPLVAMAIPASRAPDAATDAAASFHPDGMA